MGSPRPRYIICVKMVPMASLVLSITRQSRLFFSFKYSITNSAYLTINSPSVCRTDGYGTDRRLQEHALFRAKNVFRSFKVTNANIETKLEQMCCIHTRLVVCAQEHNDFSGGSP